MAHPGPLLRANPDSKSWRRPGMSRIACLSFLLAMSVATADPVNGEKPPPSQSIVVTSTDTAWEITVPVAHATLVVPRKGFQVATSHGGGAAGSPRYFLLEDRTRGEAIISGWFEPAGRVQNVDEALQSTWKGESKGLADAGLAPRSVESGKVGDWSTITYEVPVPNPSSSSVHIRASRIVGDTWIDLHLSVTSAGKAADAKVVVMQLLQSLAVRQR
jgi:hypothetical protein